MLIKHRAAAEESCEIKKAPKRGAEGKNKGEKFIDARVTDKFIGEKI